jgi:hypothetical protein
MADKPTNEMVRRLICLLGRSIVVAASNKEDHGYAYSFGWHRSWQDDVFTW